METLIYIILTVILIIILVILALYNKLIHLHNRVRKIKANIDVYLNKRFDLIPNLVECVKSYSKYEGKTLKDIVQLRSDYTKQKDLGVNKSGELNNQLNKYLAVVEAYPELKANTQYLDLQNELANIENQLERARKEYNDVVTSYNTTIETVPSNLVAGIFNFRKAELYHTEDSKKENIKVKI